jgi:cyclopropane-fatty-acyl-phospholipid synthase
VRSTTQGAGSAPGREPRDAAARRAIDFLERIFPAPRAFDVRLWNGTALPGEPGAKLTVVINSPGSLRRMIRLPIELSLGEAYLRGDFDLEGELWLAGPALEASRIAVRSPGELPGLARRWWRLPRRDTRERPSADGEGTHGYGAAPARLEAPHQSPDWDREGIRYHYDAGNEFFSLFLDRRMVYSCAYFPTGRETLDQAQELKLDLICRKLRLGGDDRLLDIGCGWGALVIHAASRYGVTALGVTLSERQQELAVRRVREAGLEDRVDVRLMDYRDVRGRTFDKIASVGMFEHVGRRRLPEYFDRAWRLLEPGGLFLNHGIAGRPRARSRVGAAIRRAVEPVLVGGAKFRERYVFPSGDLVPVSEANLVAQQAGFEVRDVENLREHYALTLRAWASRLEERAPEAIRYGGVRMYRLWRLYMGIASWQFERGEFDLAQSLLQRPAGGPSGLPMSRADLYT